MVIHPAAIVETRNIGPGFAHLGEGAIAFFGVAARRQEREERVRHIADRRFEGLEDGGPELWVECRIVAVRTALECGWSAAEIATPQLTEVERENGGGGGNRTRDRPEKPKES